MHAAAALGDGGEVAWLLLSLGLPAQLGWLQSIDAQGRTPADVADASGCAHMTHFCIHGQADPASGASGYPWGPSDEDGAGMAQASPTGQLMPRARGGGSEADTHAAHGASCSPRAPGLAAGPTAAPRPAWLVAGHPLSVAIALLVLLLALLLVELVPPRAGAGPASRLP